MSAPATTGYVEFLNPPQGGTAFWLSPVTISGGVYTVAANYNVSGEMFSFRHMDRSQRRKIQPMTSGAVNNRKVRSDKSIVAEGMYKDARSNLAGASTLQYIYENYTTVLVTQDFGGDRSQGVYEMVEYEGSMDGENNCLFSMTLEQRGSLNGSSDTYTVGAANANPASSTP